VVRGAPVVEDIVVIPEGRDAKNQKKENTNVLGEEREYTILLMVMREQKL
jgi:hypothetical protein